MIINNNNYKTSVVPTSSKTIELSGIPSTGVGQTHSLGTMQSSSTMIRKNSQGNWVNLGNIEIKTSPSNLKESIKTRQLISLLAM